MSTDPYRRQFKSAEAVQIFHSSIVSTLRSYLVLSEKALVASDLTEWQEAVHRRVSFHLVDPLQREVSYRDRGGPVVVFGITRLKNIWASWYESWDAEKQGQFMLQAVSLTFWNGEPGARAKDQLLRAEWDHPKRASANSGQPHWQIDHPVGIRCATVEPRTDPNVLVIENVNRLEDLEVVDEKWYTISSYHLGMSAKWLGNTIQYGWQSKWQDDLRDLKIWLSSCLSYFIEQAAEYPLKPF